MIVECNRFKLIIYLILRNKLILRKLAYHYEYCTITPLVITMLILKNFLLTSL